MFCMYCGKEIPDDSIFCIYCGKKVPEEFLGTEKNPDTAVFSGASVPREQTQVRQEQSEPFRNQEDQRKPARRNADRDTAKRAVPAASDQRLPAAGYGQTGTLDPYSLPTEAPSGIRRIYMFDFFLRMFQRENIPTLIYLFLNYLIVSAIFLGFFGLPVGWALLAGFVAYAASVAVALSPIGEAKLRTDCGCTKITDPDIIRRLDPIFREVYYRAKQANPSISSDVRLYMNDDDSENAFATGRKTICITRGLLNRSDSEIKAILGHEFGHLSHRDTDRVLVVAIGNTFISLFFTLMEIGVWIMDFFMNIVAIFSEEGILIWFFSTINRVFSILFIRSILRLWTWIGCMLCMKTSRGNEYQADEFSWYLGYGQGLIHFFNSLHEGRPKGLFANLERSHPVAADRIDHLMELDAA